VRKKRKITEAHRKKLRENVKKAQAKRWAKKKVIESKPESPKKIVEPNSNGHQAVIGLNDYNSLMEVLTNCAMAGLTLTRLPDVIQQTKDIQNVGAAIGEVCLEGLNHLKQAKITKKPGRPKDAKKIKTDDKVQEKSARPKAASVRE
jgi:hypothetical protein